MSIPVIVVLLFIVAVFGAILLVGNSQWYLKSKKRKLQEQIRQKNQQIAELEDEIFRMVMSDTKRILTGKLLVESINKKGVLKKQLGEIDQQLRKSFLKRF